MITSYIEYKGNLLQQIFIHLTSKYIAQKKI